MILYFCSFWVNGPPVTSRHGVADNGYLSEVEEKCHCCCCKTCIWNHALRAIKNGPYQKDWFVFYNFGLKINCATALILSEGFPGDLECVALLVLLWYLFSIFLFNENFGIIDLGTRSPVLVQSNVRILVHFFCISFLLGLCIEQKPSIFYNVIMLQCV